LGSEFVKALSKVLVKSILVVNYINILQAAFAQISFRQIFLSQTVTREQLHKKLLYEKGANKMMMKLTPSQTLGLSEVDLRRSRSKKNK